MVGARSGAVNLLLYSVFRIGNATNNIRWESYEKLAADPRVAWTIPLSLGDSHRGYRVLGTDGNYFTHYHYGRNQPLRLAQGRPFNDVFEVVLGAEVAKALHYRLGDKVVLAHGVATISLTEHSDHPFTVVGILAPTGTPVDRTLHIPLSGMTALHLDWRGGLPGPSLSDAEVRRRDLTPQDLTAALVGLKSRVATFAVQRAVNEYRGEPLLAILPGVALQELWGLLGTAEQALLVMSLCVVLTGLVGMLTALLASLNERRRRWPSCARWAPSRAPVRPVAGRGPDPHPGRLSRRAGAALWRHRPGPALAAGGIRPGIAAGLALALRWATARRYPARGPGARLHPGLARLSPGPHGRVVRATLDEAPPCAWRSCCCSAGCPGPRPNPANSPGANWCRPMRRASIPAASTTASAKTARPPASPGGRPHGGRPGRPGGAPARLRVPLMVTDEGEVTEFLLVPYYGACIHVPPPPATRSST